MAENKSKKVVYDESKVLSLNALEHIRLRPGMYIGRIGDGSNVNDGIYILVKEIIDNGVDEFIMNCGSRINIFIEDKHVSIRDYGRGIPHGSVIDCVSKINTGAKYNSDVFQFSVGLNGVGTKAVNALSSYFRVVSYREGKFFEAIFEKGKLINSNKGKTNEGNGTLIEFVPDEEIFSEYAFNNEYIEERLQNYAYLNTGLTLCFNKKAFKSKNGLLDLLDNQIADDSLYKIIHYKSDKLEFAFTHARALFAETYFSYVNGQYTGEGGTHLSAFKEGVLRGINEHFKKSWGGMEVRTGIVAAVSIKLMNPVFESQTKNKLGNTEIKAEIVQEVKEAVIDFLFKNPEETEKLNSKILANESYKNEMIDARKITREASKKVSLNIPKLKDCKHHLGQGGKYSKEGENSMIFITEGDSASGTITKTRDVYTQAVFSLRGKPKNVQGIKRIEALKNEELFNIMVALGISEGLEGLRYGKVIIATDADVDGYHIRNLLMTYFLTFYEDLVMAGRLFILETPLFRVRNKNVTKYCYTEGQRDKLIKEIKSAEITRFKGLGEIAPKEFGQFIGEDMKILPVQVSTMKEIRQSLVFYMGSNTKERRAFIMENLE
ncbi:MAG: toprim domain-containing protein [Sphaerochaetaceae bacterium]|nr:toprim domain-containing protein [Sphaerochaetaceae bacterium]